MKNARHFLQLAVRESDCPDRAYGTADLAAIAMMGAIEQVACSRDEFIDAGLDYFDRFPESAATAKEFLIENAGEDPFKISEAEAVCAIIEEWEQDLKEISLSEYFRLLASDWDERYVQD